MRVAIIDLGTNSVRFDVNQIGPGRRVTRLHREKLMVRLGQNLFVGGKLDPGAIRRTIQAFSSFQITARELKATKIIAFGTSAMREAGDSEKLLHRIRAKTGIDVRVISGEEEARLIAAGILSNEKGLKGRFGLIDIGGGSTEISICRGLNVQKAESFPVGTARLQQLFLKSSPPAAPKRGENPPIEQLRRYIRQILVPKVVSEDWPKVNPILGSSGTIRALAKIIRKSERKSDRKSFDLKDLKKLIKQMSTMTTTQLLGIPGMESRRVDMILAGAILLEETMNAIGAKKVIATEYSLRDGILEEEIQLYQQNEASNLPFHMADIYEKAIRFAATGEDEAHIEQTAALAEVLFDRLKRVHKLGNEWRHYLTAASILHDVGESISRNRHGEHSSYIVQHADFPSMQKWEMEFIGELCRLHQDGKVTSDTLSFAKEKSKRQAFVKLLALLRVADALDRSRKRAVTIHGIQVAPKKIKILVQGRSIDLELLRVEQKKNLFEEVFQRDLIVVPA